MRHSQFYVKPIYRIYSK